MSWAEVKKINGNLNKPLDTHITDEIAGLQTDLVATLAGKQDVTDLGESLGSVPSQLSSAVLGNRYSMYSGTPSPSSDVIVASVSGCKGIIRNAAFVSSNLTLDNQGTGHSNLRFILTVDGEKLFDCHSTMYSANYKTDYRLVMGLINKAFFLPTASNNPYIFVPYPRGTYSLYGYLCKSYQIYSIDSISKDVGYIEYNSSMYSAVCDFIEGIPFNESFELKIQTYTQGGAASPYVNGGVLYTLL